MMASAIGLLTIKAVTYSGDIAVRGNQCDNDPVMWTNIHRDVYMGRLL